MRERINLYLLRAIIFVIKGELRGFVRVDSVLKCKLIHFTFGLAEEYISHAIRFNAIAPGFTISDIFTLDINRYKKAFRSEEVVESALFLPSNASNSIKREVIACNGGNSIRTDVFC